MMDLHYTLLALPRRIDFPDSNDSSLAPLDRSTVVISGAIDNVYAARQNIVVGHGC